MSHLLRRTDVHALLVYHHATSKCKSLHFRGKLNSSLTQKDAMPAIRRRGKLLVLHNSVKENFSILCEVLQRSSAEEISAKLVKSYISEELKLSKYPSKDGKPTPKRRGKFAVTVGCLVGIMGLGTNQNYIGGEGVDPDPFVVFTRPAEACLPLSVPRGYFKFCLAEQNCSKLLFQSN